MCDLGREGVRSTLEGSGALHAAAKLLSNPLTRRALSLTRHTPRMYAAAGWMADLAM
jgi:hypothetical protein